MLSTLEVVDVSQAFVVILMTNLGDFIFSIAELILATISRNETLVRIKTKNEYVFVAQADHIAPQGRGGRRSSRSHLSG